jgi:two-component system sensor histidine kinase KdpD
VSARGRRAAAWLPWLGLLVAITVVLAALREQLDKAHMALAYLLLVLLGSSRGGRSVGLGLAVLSFLCFNFFLLPPHYTFRVHDPRDWLVLIAFLLTAVLGAELLDRARRQARTAMQRAEEIDRLATLGAETLNAGRAEEAVAAIAAVIRATLNIGCCEIYGPPGEHFHRIAAVRRDGFIPQAFEDFDRLVPPALEEGSAVLLSANGSAAVLERSAASVAEVLARCGDAFGCLIPLRVRERAVGILRLEDANPLRLDAAGQRFAEALSYYAALGVERVRLLADAERVEALREADRLKDALMAAVSHDLRTPLTTIKAVGHEILRDGDERAALVIEEADRLNRVVSDLLDLSRLNSGGVPLNLELNPADDLVAAAVQQTAGVLGDHELQVRIPEDDILVGRFDPVHSVRALSNLVHNAAKYSPPGSPIQLTLERKDDTLRLLVEDRGEGVPADEVERIFEPFVRLKGADRGGSGLGLSIARRLAEAQGGRVYYEARPEGGSRFVLELPAADLPVWVDD